jgi:hypothetical protein
MSASTSYGGTPPGSSGTHFGGFGLGVLGADVPSTGEHGASILFNDLSLPADAGVEVRGALVGASPAGLTSFFLFEDGSFLAAGPDGVYSFTYRLYADGVDLGTAVVTFTIGATSSGVLSGAITLADVVAAGAFASGASVLSGALTLENIVSAGAFAGLVTAGAARSTASNLSQPARPSNLSQGRRPTNLS